LKRILFVCTGNTCRSPMAQAHLLNILQNHGNNCPEEIEVLSAGLFTTEGMPASSQAIEALLLDGIDISSHRTQELSQKMLEGADLIITMTMMQCQELRERFPDKKENIHTISQLADNGDEDILDPFGMGLQSYINTSRQLKNLLAVIFNIHFSAKEENQ